MTEKGGKELVTLYDVIEELLNGTQKFVFVYKRHGDRNMVTELTSSSALKDIANYAKDQNNFQIMAYEEPGELYDLIKRTYRYHI